MNVAIVGGGIAGLSIAKALEKNQIKPIIYESAPDLKPVGAGIALAFNAMHACRSIGVYEEVFSRGLSVEKALITDHKGKVISEFNYKRFIPQFGEVSQAIHRWNLQEVLKNSLVSSQIVLDKKATGFQQDKMHVEINFADNTSVTFDFVIAADGIHSVFRQSLIPNSKPVYSGYTCWRGIGDLPATYRWKEYLNESWGPGHRLGIVPLPDNKVYWFAVKNAPEKDPEMIKASKKDILNYFNNWDSNMLSVVEATPQENIILGDIVDINPIHQFAFNNILLTGDAAHATTPNMGQGGCQALVDAAVLDKCINSTSTLNEAFKMFEQKRVDKTRRVILTSRKFGKMAQSENRIFIGIRNFLLSLIPESVNARQIMWLREEL